jgi:hypothetical protein
VTRIPERTTYREKIYSSSQFQRIPFMVAWPYVFGQNIIVMGALVKEVLHLIVDRKQRSNKGPGTRYNPQGHAPSDLLPVFRHHPQKFLDFLK